MYQPPRRGAPSASSSPRVTSQRSTHEREDLSSRRTSYEVTSGSSLGEGDSGSDLGASQSSDNLSNEARQAKELRTITQLIQNFFTKGALTVLSARATLPQTLDKNGQVSQTKWFGLVLDNSDEVLRLVTEWRLFKLDGNQYPPPMIVEIYLDLADLTRGQNLVILDDEKESRYNVADAFPSHTTSNLRPSSRSGNTQHIILERWEFSLDETADGSGSDKLPEIYKKSIPLFRALYTYTHQLPAWRYHRRMVRSSAEHPLLKPKYRIFNGQFKTPRSDTLDTPLYPGQVSITDSYTFPPWRIPVGDMSVSVTYRNNCNFRIDGTESLLSSQFKGQDDRRTRTPLTDRQAGAVPSSLPTSRRAMIPEDQNKGQVYGSMATFHRMGPAPGTSPISALRAAREVGSYSPSDPAMASLPSTQKSTLDRKSSLRQEAAPSIPRRQSVSFQPFKAGTLASSPGRQPPPSPGSSVGRATDLDAIARARHRNSLSSQTLPQTAQRIPVSVQDAAITSSASSSPRPAPINRYSSSFGHRRTRLSIGGSVSKGEDDQNSSGKQSTSSSTKREGSDVLAEGQTGGSSGSIQNAQKDDDDDLKDFIRLLEAKKQLKSFNRSDSATNEASMRRTTAALTKYRGMREGNTALGDSLSTSLMMHRSSSSSNPSQKLGSVPGMIPGSSMSISSSPGKPISPHTPHTPAIPSNLSANEVVDYGDAPRRSSRHRRSERMRTHEEVVDDVGSDSTARDTAAMGAIDIPTSPRAWPFGRRSSSVSQRNRVPLDDEPELFGLRSSSLPGAVDDRPDLSMSELVRLTENLDIPSVLPQNQNEPSNDQLEPERPTCMAEQIIASEDSSTLPPADPAYSLAARQNPRYRRLSRGSPLYGATSSTSASASASASASVSDSRQTGPTAESRGRFGSSRSSLAHRPSSERDVDEDEPAMFQMSDIANSSRRSLEQGRGDGAAGQQSRGGASRGGWR